MGSRRQERFTSLVQQELADIFLKEGKNAFGAKFITVNKVRVSADLGYVKVYLGFPGEKEPEKILKKVQDHAKVIRRALGSRIRHQVKKIPEVEIFYDDTMDYVEKMERLFEEIHKKEGKKGKN